MAIAPGRLNDSLKSRMDALRDGERYDMEQACMIYRLPTFFCRDENKVLFEPCAVSIGPYYRGRANLQDMEEYKLRYLREFLAWNKDQISLETCIHEIQLLEERSRQCYNEQIDLSSDEFVEMLLLDSCFILVLSLKYFHQRGIMCRPGFLFDPIWMDLLLFENQIPFFVLETLFFLIPDCDRGYLFEVLQNFFNAHETPNPPRQLNISISIRHLLHLYHEMFVPRPVSQPVSAEDHNIFCCVPSRFSCCRSDENSSQRSQLVIPCAVRLHEAGVKFKENASCENKFDIMFNKGVMKIPTIKINTNLKPLYPNLLAFEVCLCARFRTLSSYIVLLDLLINTKEDIEILQKYDVIESTLPNEEELACYLNLIGKVAFLDYSDHYYVKTFKDINEYCHSRWNKQRARLVHDYFSTPWAVMSVIAAFLLLILTIIQAFFAFYPYMKRNS